MFLTFDVFCDIMNIVDKLLPCKELLMFRLLGLLRKFDGDLIADLIAVATSVQDKLEDGLTREELDTLLSEVDGLADHSQTQVDDDLIQFMQRLIRDPFIINYVFTRVGFEGAECDHCPEKPSEGCCLDE